MSLAALWTSVHNGDRFAGNRRAGWTQPRSPLSARFNSALVVPWFASLRTRSIRGRPKYRNGRRIINTAFRFDQPVPTPIFAASTPAYDFVAAGLKQPIPRPVAASLLLSDLIACLSAASPTPYHRVRVLCDPGKNRLAAPYGDMTSNAGFL